MSRAQSAVKAFVVAWAVLLGVVAAGTAATAFVADSWGEHLTFGSRHVEGVVTSVEDGEGTCPVTSHTERPDRTYVVETADGPVTLDGCGLDDLAVGDDFDGWLTDDGEAFGWPAWQLYLFLPVPTAAVAAAVTVPGRRRSRHPAD